MSNISSLSILIPVFNCSVYPLIKELGQQALTSGISYEILCYDDLSLPEYKNKNMECSAIPNVIYKELPKNLGRSAIRNLMASEAQYPNLLFLDCDGKIIQKDFIASYLGMAEYDVVIGGRVYSLMPPENPLHHLHWKAGSKKEVISAKKRNETPYHSLMLNNLLISKKVFEELKLDESIQGYGHEDTLFGIQLKEKKASIVHIENPVLHESLDGGMEFLAKTREAVKNLAYIVNKHNKGKETRLYKMYKKLSSLWLAGLFAFGFSVFKNRASKNLQGSRPKLFWLDLIKLYWFIKDMKVRN